MTFHQDAFPLEGFAEPPERDYGTPSPREIMAARTHANAWTRDQLAKWGVPWPPPKGWKGELEQRWREAVAAARG